MYFVLVLTTMIIEGSGSLPEVLVLDPEASEEQKVKGVPPRSSRLPFTAIPPTWRCRQSCVYQHVAVTNSGRIAKRPISNMNQPFWKVVSSGFLYYSPLDFPP